MYERTYNAKLKQKELPKEKRPFNWKRLFTILGILIVVGGTVYVIRLPQLQVHEVLVDGASVTDPEEISSFVQENITGNYLFILPRKSMLLVPTAILTKKVAEAFPRFSSVDVRRKGVNNLIVTVAEHSGAYLWCVSPEECSFMNKDGLVYAEAPTFSGNAYVKLFGGEKGVLPFTPLSADDRAVAAHLIEKLPSIEVSPTEFHFVSEHEFDVFYVHNGRDVKLMFDPQNDIDTSLNALYTAFRTDAFAKKYHDPVRALEYIDLRFPNKVVYKFL